MKYIDADKLISEIEKYKQGAAIARFDNAGENADYFQGKVDLCDDLQHIIDSLQHEQPEVDLEKEIEMYISSKGLLDYAFLIPSIARHFYELARQKYEK